MNRTILFILSILSISVFGCRTEIQTSQRILGNWESVKFEGRDIGDFFKRMEFSFNSDSTFVGAAFMKDSTSNERRGVYYVTNDSLTMKSNGEGGTGKLVFLEDTLVIFDPKIDSRVYLIRKKEK